MSKFSTIDFEVMVFYTFKKEVIEAMESPEKSLFPAWCRGIVHTDILILNVEFEQSWKI